jgi:hypothetical protein
MESWLLGLRGISVNSVEPALPEPDVVSWTSVTHGRF